MKLQVGAIQVDTSIQCRAAIDTGVVNDYAERMQAGDIFPPIDVFGTKSKCWIGDGWHRFLAAKSLDAESIDAHLQSGGRADALKHALGANALHGHRRTNADKRRCVEIALREFPRLSSRAVAKLCGVDHKTVEAVRPVSGGEVPHVERTGQDGKQYPATREAVGPPREITEVMPESPVTSPPRPVLGPPANGMQFARMALLDLEQIRDDDVERGAAFDCVLNWIRERR